MIQTLLLALLPAAQAAPPEFLIARSRAHIELMTSKVHELDVPPPQKKHAIDLLATYKATLSACPDAEVGEEIIDLFAGVSMTAFTDKLAKMNPPVAVEHEYPNMGNLVVLKDVSADQLSIIASWSDMVEQIDPDCTVSAVMPVGEHEGSKLLAGEAAGETTIPSDVWSLHRIDQIAAYRSSQGEAFKTEGDGTGVIIYVLDTGVRGSHEDFESRARAVKAVNCLSAGGCFLEDSYSNDGNGHGTHCASSAAGKGYGVAKGAEVVAVKVLSDQGGGTWAGILAGIDWAIAHIGAQTGKRGVISMSLGGSGPCSGTSSMGRTIQSAKDAGIPVVLAAGNDNSDTANFNPASCPASFAVGSTTKDDVRSGFSNFGARIDIWAPGSAIKAAWWRNDANYNTISGTSMACPHVAGAFAILLGNAISAGKTVADFTANDAYAAIKCAAVGLDPDGGNADLKGGPNKMLQVQNLQTGSCGPTAAPTAAPTYAGGVEVTGPCTWDGRCASDGSSSYNNNVECTFSGLPSSPMTVVEFDIEADGTCGFDYLEIGAANGVPATKYCGTSGPPAGTIASSMKFHSDHSVTHAGFKICFGAAPTAAPVAAPIAAPVAAPIAAPVAAPIAAPVAAPIAAPVAAPIAAPVAAPIAAPVAAPIAAPVAAPIAAPVAAPSVSSCPDLFTPAQCNWGKNNQRCVYPWWRRNCATTCDVCAPMPCTDVLPSANCNWGKANGRCGSRFPWWNQVCKSTCEMC